MSKSKSSSKSKGKPGGGHSISEQYFKRELNQSYYPIHSAEQPDISLYLFKKEVSENWLTVPHIVQFSNSNSGGDSSKKNKTPAGVAALALDEYQEYQHEPCLLSGLVVGNKHLLQKGYGMFVRITAFLQYAEEPTLPPYRENVITSYQAFDKTMLIFPTEWLFQEGHWSEQEQRIIRALMNHVGKDKTLEKFSIDLTSLPDSMNFQRPGFKNYTDGIFWKVYAYLAKESTDTPFNNEMPTINFVKQTFIDCEKNNNPYPSSMERFLGPCDDGTSIRLNVILDKEIYYHGEEIKVTLTIENDSSRTVVQKIAISVEQNIRFLSQIPQSIHNVLDRVLIGPGQNGLPINPKTKNYSYSTPISFSHNPNIYNLVVTSTSRANILPRIANSSFIMFHGEIDIGSQGDVLNSENRSKSKSPDRSRSKNKNRSNSNSKKEKSLNKSPSGKSDKDNQKKSPIKTKKEELEVIENGKNPINNRKPIHILTNRQKCRPVFVSYDVVVKIDLKNNNKEWVGGSPSLRVPFILAMKKPKTLTITDDIKSITKSKEKSKSKSPSKK